MVTGYLLVNKPDGPTSHDIVDLARKKLGVRRIGHTGTLDPFASGLLILLVGREATKRQDEFLKLDKEYLATALWGYESDTYDVTGKISVPSFRPSERSERRRNPKREKISPPVGQRPLRVEMTIPSQEQIEKTLEKFRGEIVQTVPAYSAVKVGGKKLYELARAKQGESLTDARTLPALPKRQVVIYEFEKTEDSPPDTRDWSEFKAKLSQESLAFTHFRIHCSSGTYVRSLIHDLGQELGCGALCAALQRTKIGNFDLKDAVEVDEISEFRMITL